ncbi:MAG: hypothetical protein RLZZ52_1181 [Actinomycetota bacterium]
MIEIATDDAKAITEERDEKELEQLRRSMGIAEGDAIPSNLRSQVKGLEEQQKRRATRSLRDGLDRILVDLLSVYRDVLRLQLGVGEDLINVEFGSELHAAALARTSEDTLATMEAIGVARERIDANVAPALAMEALLIWRHEATLAFRSADRASRAGAQRVCSTRCTHSNAIG